MENKHISQKLKSSYLLTLIFSYTGYLRSVILKIRYLCKAGDRFVEVNSEQLKVFCPKFQGLDIFMPENSLIYLSKRIKQLSSLTVESYSELNLISQSFQNLEDVDLVQIKFLPNYTNESFSQETIVNLLSKTKKISFQSEEVVSVLKFEILKEIRHELPNLEGLEVDSRNLYTDQSMQSFLRIQKHLKELVLSCKKQNETIVTIFRELSKLKPTQIEKFTFKSPLYVKEQFFKDLQAAMFSFKNNLMFLSLHMEQEILNHFIEQNQAFENLIVLEIRAIMFDLSLLELFPKLRVFKLKYEYLKKLQNKQIDISQFWEISLIDANFPAINIPVMPRSKFSYLEDLILTSTQNLKALETSGQQNVSLIFNNKNYFSNLILLKITAYKEFKIYILEKVLELKNLKTFDLFLASDCVVSQVDAKNKFCKNKSIQNLKIETDSAKLKDLNYQLFIRNFSTFLKNLTALQNFEERYVYFCVQKLPKTFIHVQEFPAMKSLTIWNYPDLKNSAFLKQNAFHNPELNYFKLLRPIKSDELDLIIPIIRTSPKLLEFSIDQIIIRDTNEPLIKLFEAVKIHPNLKALSIEFFLKDIEDLTLFSNISFQNRYLVHEKQLLFDLQNLALQSCKNIKQLKLCLIKQSKSHQEGESSKCSFVQAKQEVFQQLTTNLPQLDVLII